MPSVSRARRALLLLACRAALPPAALAAARGCASLPPAALGQFARRGCCPPPHGPSPGLGAVLDRLASGAARVLLVGDSLTVQTFEALRVECLLQAGKAGGGGGGAHPRLAHGTYGCAVEPPVAVAGGGAGGDEGPPACPHGSRRVASCAAAPEAAWCDDVRALSGAAPGGAPLSVVLLEAPLFALPDAYVSAAVLDVIRREWPEYNRRLRRGGGGGGGGGGGSQQPQQQRLQYPALPPPVFERWVGWADRAVVNAGSAYDALPVMLYSETLRFVRDVLAADRARARPGGGEGGESGGGEGKRHVYRATYPSHGRVAVGGGAYRKAAAARGGAAAADNAAAAGAAPGAGAACNASAVAPRHWGGDLAARLLGGAGDGVWAVDAHDVMASAGALHSLERRDGPAAAAAAAAAIAARAHAPSPPPPRDCLHWCFSWALFGPVWERISSVGSAAANGTGRGWD